MSLLNAWIHPEYALIGVDSDAVSPALGARAEVSKLVSFAPHMPAVIAGRGVFGFLPPVVMGAMMHSDNFDRLVEKMPDILRASFAQLADWQKAKIVHESAPIEGETIVLVGWSQREGRIIGHEWVQTSAAEGFIADTLRPHHIAPWNQSLDHLAKDVRVPSDMESLARAQVALMREHAPQEATGGKLILARLERDRVTIRQHCDLDAARVQGLGGAAVA